MKFKTFVANVLLFCIILSVGMSYNVFDYSGWNYYSEINISNPNPTTLSDFQIKLNIDTQNLISQGYMKSDCSDIRFVDPDNNYELPYWIEGGCNTHDTTIWVKVDEIPANSFKKILMVSGNPTAVSKSNGTAVFEFFDDFDKVILDLNKWETNANVFTIENGHIRMWGSWNENNYYLRTRNEFKLPFIVGGKVKSENPTSDNDFQVYIGGNVEVFDSKMCVILDADNRDKQAFYDSDWIAHKVGAGFLDTNWHKFKFIFKDGDFHNWWDGGTDIKSTKITNIVSSKIGIGADTDSTSIVDLDYVFVRKYADKEPTTTISQIYSFKSADLTIIDLYPTEGYTHTNNKYSVVIKNIGNANLTGCVQLYVYANGTLINNPSSNEICFLGINETITENVTFYTENPGDYLFKAYLNTKSVLELNKTNNEKTFTVEIIQKKKDLMVENIELPEHIVKDTSYNIKVYVKNTGELNLTDCYPIKVYDNYNLINDPTTTQICDINVNETKYIETIWTPTSSGTHVLSAVLDTNDWDNTNNEYKTSVFVNDTTTSSISPNISVNVYLNGTKQKIKQYAKIKKVDIERNFLLNGYDVHVFAKVYGENPVLEIIKNGDVIKMKQFDGKYNNDTYKFDIFVGDTDGLNLFKEENLSVKITFPFSNVSDESSFITKRFLFKQPNWLRWLGIIIVFGFVYLITKYVWSLIIKTIGLDKYYFEIPMFFKIFFILYVFGGFIIVFLNDIMPPGFVNLFLLPITIFMFVTGLILGIYTIYYIVFKRPKKKINYRYYSYNWFKWLRYNIYKFLRKKRR